MRSVLITLLLLLPALASATDVKGTLSTPTVWTRRGSPYVLKGDVTVAWGTKLTIEPGVRIIASAGDALRSGEDPERVELIVDGALVVRGTRSRPVELTAQGTPGSWYGIRVRGGRGTVIDGAIITQARQGISLGMSAVVRNTTVSATARDCLQVRWGQPTLEGNQLSECGENGSSVSRRTPLQRTGLFEARVRGRVVFAHLTHGPRGGAFAHAFGRPPRRPGIPSSVGSVSPPPARELPAVAHRTLPPRTGGTDGEIIRWRFRSGSSPSPAGISGGLDGQLTEVATASEAPIAGPEPWTSPGRVRKKPGWPEEPRTFCVTWLPRASNPLA